MTAQPIAHRTVNLLNKPELAAAIGVFVAQFAQFEFSCFILVARALRTESEREAQELFRDNISIANILKASERLAQYTVETGAERAIFSDQIKRCLELIDFRNRLMHHLYVEEPNGDIVLIKRGAKRGAAPLHLNDALVMERALELLDLQSQIASKWRPEMLVPIKTPDP